MIRAAISISLIIVFLFSSVSPVFAQPSFKLPWDLGLGGVQITSGPHGLNAKGRANVCEQVAPSYLTALDFALRQKDVLAAAPGKIISVSSDSFSGNYVLIDHDDGWTTGYYHLESFSVSVGSQVLQGTKIGTSGNTGSGAGGAYHLHFAVKPYLDGVVIDGYRVNAVRYRPDPSKAFNYLGTLTKGSESTILVSGQCSGNNQELKRIGAEATADPEYPQFSPNPNIVYSTNRKVETLSCSIAPGAGSSRQGLFQQAYERVGEGAVLGCALTPAHWWNGIVIQLFPGAPGVGESALMHDEVNDVDEFGKWNSFPAYLVQGGFWTGFYKQTGPVLGPPTSDHYLNAFGRPQTDFRQGFAWWTGASAVPRQTLLKGSGPEVYFMERGVRRWIPNPETLSTLGYSFAEVQTISDSEIAIYPLGSSIPTVGGNAWLAQYYENARWMRPPEAVRGEGEINFNWGEGSPEVGILADRFSARFIGNLNFPTSGPYTFHGVFDDVGVVYLGGQQIINYRCCGAPQPVVNVNASAGENRLRVDFTEDYGGAAASFRWDAPVRPTSSASVSFAPQGSSGWYNTDVPVVVSGSSPYGIERVAWRFEDSDWESILAYGNAATLPSITKEGVRSLRYNVQDVYGNWGDERVIGVKIDKTAPSTQITTLKEGERYNSQSFPGIFGTATDNLSGVVRVEVRVERGGEVVVPWTSAVGANGWTFANFPFEDGGYTLSARATDLAGNWESTAQVSFVYDNTSPRTSISLQGPSFESEEGKVFVSPETGFALEAKDNLSGVSQTTFSVDEEEEQLYEGEFSLNGQDGQHAIEYSSEDNAGNVEPTNSQEVFLDSTAPVSADNSDGRWHNEDVTVAITAQDPPAPGGTAGSGVQKINYDGAQEGEVLSGQAQVTFTEEGTHDLTYFAVDNVENVEEEKEAAPIKIDKTPPDITGAPTEELNENNWYNEDVTVHFRAEDQEHLSGVKSVTPDVFVSTEGANQKVTGVAEDNAGNIASTTVSGISIDKTPPESRLDPLQPYYNALPLDTDYSASDNLSGVDRVRLYQSYQGGDWEYHHGSSREPDRPFVVGTLGEGRWEFSTCAVDRADNEECNVSTVGDVNGAQASTIYDATPPQSQTELNGIEGENGWYVSPVELAISTQDPQPYEGREVVVSGVEKIEYKVNGEDVKSYYYTSQYDTDDIYSGSYWAADKAGNVEDSKEIFFKIDQTLPSSQITSLAEGAYYNAQSWPGIKGIAGDNLSGVARVGVQIVKDEAVLADWAVALGTENWFFEDFPLEDGLYVASSRATDFASNQEHTFRVAFAYDATPPITSVNLGGSSGLSGWYVSPVVLSLSAKDVTSGVEKPFYRLEGSDPQAYAEPVKFGNGVHNVEFWSIDRAGNEERHQTLTLRVDSIAPAAPTASVAGGSFFDGEQVVVSLVGEEGVQIYYSLNGGGEILYTTLIGISADAILSAYALDEAGNKSETASWNFVFKLQPASPIPNQGGSVPQVLGVQEKSDSGKITPVSAVEAASSSTPSRTSPTSSHSLLTALVTFFSSLFSNLGGLLSLILRKVLLW